MTHDKIVIDGIVYKLTPELVTENLHNGRSDEVHFPKIDYQFADKEMTWQEAVDYAKSLGEGWRLPTKEELQANAAQLKTASAGNSKWFWSGSTVSYTTPRAWFVDLAGGFTSYDTKDNSYGVVCVRP